MSSQLSSELYVNEDYVPPAWMRGAISEDMIPAKKVRLGRFPTPYHRWKLAEEDAQGLEVWVKRDDLSSFDLGGNKVRKLQFLMAEALSQSADTTVTIGAAQSNHARATAVASRQLGMQPYIILRTRGEMDADIGSSLVGNLLWDKMVGAKIYTVTSAKYHEAGQYQLVDHLANKLRDEGKNVYTVPVGGSNPCGAFGYLDFIEEVREQMQQVNGLQFDHLVFACGSGGTATGISLGAKLAGIPNIHGVCVCDSPDVFYGHITETAAALGVDSAEHGSPRDWLSLYDGAGIGYGRSTPEELEFVVRVARTTGVTLDPVYSGKGLYYFLHKVVQQNPDVFKRGQRVMFVHTGGGFGLYDKVGELSSMMAALDSQQTTALPLDGLANLGSTASLPGMR